MATPNITRIASAIGTIHPDELANLLADSRYSMGQVAAIAGTTLSRLTALLAEPVLYRRPTNWTTGVAVGTVFPYPGPFFGLAAQVYAGPSEPGLTYGDPVYVPDVPHSIASKPDF